MSWLVELHFEVYTLRMLLCFWIHMLHSNSWDIVGKSGKQSAARLISLIHWKILRKFCKSLLRLLYKVFIAIPIIYGIPVILSDLVSNVCLSAYLVTKDCVVFPLCPTVLYFGESMAYPRLVKLQLVWHAFLSFVCFSLWYTYASRGGAMIMTLVYQVNWWVSNTLSFFLLSIFKLL